jgi:ABC-type Fe3+/spermidine/putrescine transport system ATPase subunit
MSVVEVEGLLKRFGDVTAVDRISFEIEEREFFSLLGPSGCGKTTTLRCVAGLETGEAGRIRIGEQTVFDAARRLDVPTNRRAIGMVFQSYAVWPHMTVFENIAYPLRIRGMSRQTIRERVARVLAILGMPDLEARLPSQLSGGQQQRVALGRALAVEPTVLLLDEPLSNLDAKLREQMRAELKQVQRETGLPILYVTHDQIEALAMSDRIAVMHEGRIHQLADPVEIYQRPATQFVLDFIGTVNYLPCTVDGAADGRLSLTLEDGQTFAIPRPSHVPDGDRVLLAVRPEDVTLGEDGLVGEVVLRSFLGGAVEYRIRVGASELRVQTPKHVVAGEGARVGLVIDEGLLLERDARERPEARAS